VAWFVVLVYATSRAVAWRKYEERQWKERKGKTENKREELKRDAHMLGY
jgi:hypothetical protein